MNNFQEPKFNAVRGKIVNRDTGKAIPDDEPVFIFRGKDPHLTAVLRAYKKLCKNGNHKKVIQARINQIVAFQKANKDLVREPDSEKAAVLIERLGS